LVIEKTSIAGTLESSDIMITIAPGEDGISIDLTSTVEKQFGRQIRSEIEGALREIGVTGAKVTAVDKGALDCAIRARVRAAAYRAAGEKNFPWGGAGHESAS